MVEPDSDLFAALMTSQFGDRCAFGKALDEMSEGSRAAVEKAIENGIRGTTISRTLRAKGLPGADQATIRRHLAGACRCVSG